MGGSQIPLAMPELAWIRPDEQRLLSWRNESKSFISHDSFPCPHPVFTLSNRPATRNIYYPNNLTLRRLGYSMVTIETFWWSAQLQSL